MVPAESKQSWPLLNKILLKGISDDYVPNLGKWRIRV